MNSSTSTKRSLLPKRESLSSSASPTLEVAGSSTGEQQQQAPKRRCVSSACMPCRKRKSKCDGKKPTCHACTAVYNSTCFYDIDSDHRRKGALKRDIAQLKEDLGPRNSILEAIRKGSEADVDDIVQLIRSNPEERWESIAESVNKLSIAATQKAAPSSYLEGELNDFAYKALAKPGDTRQYGHTSNLSFLIAEDEGAPASEVKQFGTWTKVTSDNGLIKHLLAVYLSWSHPLYTMFSEELFIHGMQDRKLKHCTPLLVNAVLAVGCHFSDRPGARADPADPSTIGEHFFAEAEKLLLEDRRPCLTTIQAMGLMSLHQAMNNRDSSGWLYMCQTMGMVVELGLHKDQQASLGGNITPPETAVRRITFWGCYFIQTAWSICAGRISVIPRAAIRMDKPILLNRLESKLWKPYGHPSYHDANKRLEQAGLRYTIQSHLSLLCEIADDILQMFYAPRDRITSRRLQIQHEKLQAWFRELPDSLAIKNEGPTLPQVISLHIFHHNCIVQLFQPFLRVSFVESSKTPRQICIENAHRISELMDLYKRTYGLQRIAFLCTHFNMTAVIIHIVALSGSNLPPAVFEQTETHIVNGIHAFYDMMASFPVVERFLKATRGLLARWLPVIPLKIRIAISDSPTQASPEPFQSVPPTHNTSHRQGPDPVLETPYIEPSTIPFRNQVPTDQNLFWTPFPGGDGVPLGPPANNKQINQHMDITNMLSSGIMGDLPQLNRDGFTMVADNGALRDLI